MRCAICSARLPWWSGAKRLRHELAHVTDGRTTTPPPAAPRRLTQSLAEALARGGQTG